ncbi:50S ribosomal protein L5 [Pseudenhygromyxa sp. WMMC2535]|uniref:50S ribosomal protein L5 n=1 Tax=Pseudenhygromyxa sp. WMMC2535 TaxID=2712867 RepID=UPI001552C583|nr:50S ribosomal protein L5 [Pseudenhygromyxa sp. WMMC2535]NVB36810.1 50S ribosomal protein L5 [Pseudenhygromyxa sp. WMMC2535]
MAKAQGGATPKKKQEAGYAFKFPQVREAEPTREGYVSPTYQRYIDECVPALKEAFNYKNPHTIPRVEKIVLNIGLGEAIKQPKLLEQSFEVLGNITGQRPVVTRAKKSIAGFKLREGMKIGAMVTLRRAQMWDFLDRLLLVALPRTRDFRGVSPKAFDGRGNYTLGIKEILIFPEVDIEKLNAVPGMNVCIHTSARKDDEARALLKHLGMPFRK